jgi:two-component system, chemotaxis family, protein-glutamate methylesterase/glutaminase
MRVLVVDDSTLFRKIVRDAIADEPGVEVVGTAVNGMMALEKIEQLKPDVVTLDLEMPEIDGLEVLRRLQRMPSPPRVLMLSSFTIEGASLTTQALRLGAFDFIRKPNAASLEANCTQLRAEIGPKLRLVAAALQRTTDAGERTSSASCPLPANTGPAGRIATAPAPEIIAIGVSTGGPAALAMLLPKLPADLPTPIVIVQHMPPIFTKSMADDLDRMCKLRVREAAGGERLTAGHVYIAPGGRQMKVVRGGYGSELCVTDEPPEKNCRPSVDYLFRSLAHLYGDKVLAIILTGMGDDGALGCKLLKRNGATIIAQNEATCVVYGMPRQIVDLGLADAVLSLDGMHSLIVDRARREALECR